MKISLNELKKYVPEANDYDTPELVRLIGSRLVEVEEAIDLAPKYAGIKIVEVAECEPIEGTHLHLCQVNDGNALVQVVCGAPNVHKGMLAAWLAPGCIVPQTYGEEDFTLDVRKLRGYDSHGMLAGLDELDLAPDHSGIVEIDPSMKLPDGYRSVQPGDDFAYVFGLNDVVLDIENKSLTHRPDTFGLLGFARELAGILGVKFGFAEDVEHGILQNMPREGSRPSENEPPVKTGRRMGSGECHVDISIEDETLCPRYSCAVFNLKEPAQSKYLTLNDVFLAKSGMYRISPLVDLTNILMLQLGQPMHAFDYDKFLAIGKTSQPKIIIRAAKNGEKLRLLDGKVVECDDNDILITSNNVPVALAGAMGGADTEIDENTKNIILESATFSLYHLRRTQMKHGIFSEAITRFTKGQPAARTMFALNAATELIGQEPLALADAYPNKLKTPEIPLSADDVNSLLGTDYDLQTIKNTLANVGIEECELPNIETSCSFRIPHWRTDLSIKQDLIEEVARLLGYDNIPLALPTRSLKSATTSPIVALKVKLRHFLSDNLGMNELLTYSFVSKDLQSQVGEDPRNSYEIINSLSPELQCFRQSLIPSLIDKARDNYKAGYKTLNFYELNQVTNQSLGLDADGVPVMQHHLALLTTGDYYRAKSALVALLTTLGHNPELKSFAKDPKYFEPKHSATIYIADQPVGYLGEIRRSVARSFKLDQTISACELDLGQLLSVPPSLQKSRRFSKYPAVERDLTIKVSPEFAYKKALDKITSALAKSPHLVYDVSPASIFQKDDTAKNLSFHLKFASLKSTLDNSEISAIMEEVTNQITALGAEVV